MAYEASFLQTKHSPTMLEEFDNEGKDGNSSHHDDSPEYGVQIQRHMSDCHGSSNSQTIISKYKLWGDVLEENVIRRNTGSLEVRDWSRSANEPGHPYKRRALSHSPPILWRALWI